MELYFFYYVFFFCNMVKVWKVKVVILILGYYFDSLRSALTNPTSLLLYLFHSTNPRLSPLLCPLSLYLPLSISLSLDPSPSLPSPFFSPYLFLSLTLPGYCPHSLYHTVVTLTPSFFYSFSHTLSHP